MQKRIILELEIESEWESSVYAAVGDLLADIEDNDSFRVKSVEVGDVPPLKLAASTKLVDVKTRNYDY